MPDIVGSEQHEPTSRWAIANKAKADKHHRFRDLYRCLNAEFLLDCWSDLNKDAASGVDGVTAQSYAEHLQTNIEGLVERLKSKRYRAKLVRRVYIPKEKGKERPLVTYDLTLDTFCEESAGNCARPVRSFDEP